MLRRVPKHHSSSFVLKRPMRCLPPPPKHPEVTLRLLSTTKKDEEKVPLPVNRAIELAPGIVASAAVMGVSFEVANHLGQALLAAQGVTGGASPISGIPVAIVLGVLANNTLSLPASLKPGLKFATTTILRGGIVCVGFKLSMADLVNLGAMGFPIVCASVGTGLLVVPWISQKLELSRKLGLLIAAGTSICGVTAISALAPVIKANEKEVAFAIANVVCFGTLGMLTYPYLAHAVMDTSEQVGMFLGLAVHDTSQVLGAALTYSEVYHDELALKTAAVTKLMRNCFLVGVIPGLGWLNAKHEESQSGGKKVSLADVRKFIPSFVIGFVAASCIRSYGDSSLASDMLAYGMFDAPAWEDLSKTIGNKIGSHYCLGTAMAAVGLSTSATAFKGVGMRPFAAGLGGSAVVGSMGFTLAYLFAGGG